MTLKKITQATINGNFFMSFSGITVIIIHSKYFPNSDWLKAHT